MKTKFTENLELALDNLHTKGAFLTVQNEGKVNTMTISWGNIGYEWNRPIFTILVRKSRYTHEFLEKTKEFTVSIPTDESFKNSLSICGSKSGRDIDKIKECTLETIPSEFVSAPVINGCGICYECKIVYSQDMDVSKLPEEIRAKSYKTDPIHTIYYGEILNIHYKK